MVLKSNHERATSACVDWLTRQPEVDPERIGVMGISMGPYWSTRLAARDLNKSVFVHDRTGEGPYSRQLRDVNDVYLGGRIEI
jgi:dienelactone hydrolase